MGNSCATCRHIEWRRTKSGQITKGQSAYCQYPVFPLRILNNGVIIFVDKKDILLPEGIKIGDPPPTLKSPSSGGNCPCWEENK